MQVITQPNSKPTYTFNEPALVGDYFILNGAKQTIIRATNVYKRTGSSHQWIVSYEIGELPKPKTLDELKLDYYQKMYDTKAIIRDEVLKLVDERISNLIKYSTTATGVILPLSPAYGDANEKVNDNYKYKINEALKKEDGAGYSL